MIGLDPFGTFLSVINGCSSTAIRHGFIEALEMEDSVESEETDADAEGAGHGSKLAVLHLLIEGVNLPHPSFAHYLLGFDIHSPLSKCVPSLALSSA